MTFKKIVENLIKKDARAWMEDLCAKNMISIRYIGVEGVTLEKESKHYSYTADLWIRRNVVQRYYPFKVCGTVDDLLGICRSVIWDREHNLIWLDAEDLRKEMGIEKFDPFRENSEN